MASNSSPPMTGQPPFDETVLGTMSLSQHTIGCIGRADVPLGSRRMRTTTVGNLLDNCPNTPSNGGCLAERRHGDGVTNDIDLCPSTPSMFCQSNGDGDGIVDCLSKHTTRRCGLTYKRCTDGDSPLMCVRGWRLNATCVRTHQGWLYINPDGCSEAQLDSDGDGVSDLFDQCPTTPANTVVGADGCNAPPVCELFINDSGGTNAISQSLFDLSSDQTESDVTLPIGDYLFTVNCVDPEGQTIDMTVTIGTNSPQTFRKSADDGPHSCSRCRRRGHRENHQCTWDDVSQSGRSSRYPRTRP